MRHDAHLAANTPLCAVPLWRPEDLGKPMPDSPHAASVAMPLWEHVVGYEEGDPAIRDALRSGYPRFLLHPFIRELVQAHLGDRWPAEEALPFPSEKIAKGCIAFITAKSVYRGRVERFRDTDAYLACFPAKAFDIARKYWQHFGEIVNSRQAHTLVHREPTPDGGAEAKATIRARIAECSGADADDVFLYPTGMAALTEALRMAQARRPQAHSVQFGFPYVDVLKIQTEWGPGAHFYPKADVSEFDAVQKLLAEEPVSCVICEFPGNPLLRGSDIPALADITHANGALLIVDDTPATYHNVDLLPHADIVISSLTKAFSGVGDVMAGGLIVGDAHAHAEKLRAYQRDHYADLFWDGDAVVLEANSRDFPARMEHVNTTAERLCDYLREHSAVDRVYYPKYEIPAEYDRVKKPGGGYGGLFSILLKDAAKTAAPFYDRLRVSKGPSLGNNFTMACPFTLLAHYDELDWAESIGVSRYLVRVSVGLEEADDLIARFGEALG